MAIPSENISLSFEDLSITPRIPQIPTRNVCIKSRAVGNLYLNTPFISSPMDTVTNSCVAIEMARNGGLGILHNNYPQATLNDEIRKVIAFREFSSETATLNGENLAVGVLIPTNLKCLTSLEYYIELGINIFAVDSLHVAPQKVLRLIEDMRSKYPDLLIISGNVAHPDDASRMINCGANAIRVGYSAASVNKGQGMYGIGSSQVDAIMRCSIVAKRHNIPLIADGGVKTPADIAIAFALGANCVMSGRLFASSDEAPGQATYQNGKLVKTYLGMSRPGLIDSDMPPEAKHLTIEATGSISSILAKHSWHLMTSIARAGCVDIESFFSDAEISILSSKASLSQL